MSETNTRNPKPGPEQTRLAPIVGRWRTEGQTVAGPDEPSAQIRGADTYEWFPGGFFLLHHVDVRMGEEQVRALEVIGYDAEREAYFARSFDNSGAVGEMQLEVGGSAWTLSEATTRARIVFGEDGSTADVRWERRDEGSDWRPWMSLTLTRQA